MSDIFKRIKSFEADDNDALDALGLRPIIPDVPISDAKANDVPPADNTDEPFLDIKPLNLTIPVDEDGEPIENADTETIRPPKAEFMAEDIAPASIRPLGLTPVVPVTTPDSKAPDDKAPDDKAKDSQLLKPITGSIPKPPRATPAPEDISNAPPKANRATNKAQKDQDIKADPVPNFVTRSPVAQANDTVSVPRFGRIIIMGVIAAVIWALCAIGFTLWGLGGLSALKAMSPFKLFGFAVLILIPMMIFLFCAYALRELSRLSVHSDRLSRAAQAMISPDETVIARTAVMSKAVQTQIEDVNLKISSALSRMEMLDDVVKSQSSALSQSTLAAENTAGSIASTLTAQREALDAVADTFEARMAALSTTLDGHAENLSQSTQTAEQKIQEARISIEGAAEKINSASDVVRQNAVSAAETLSGSQTEITMLGNAVKARSDEMDAVYRKHVADLTAMIDHLKKEQDEMGAILEERLTKMRDMSLSAKVGAQSLSEASDKGRATVEALADAARLTDTAVRARFKEMEDMVKYSTARAESISDTAARQVQNSLSMTRKEIGRIEADMMDLMDRLSRSQNAQIMREPVVPTGPTSIPANLEISNNAHKNDTSGSVDSAYQGETIKPRRVTLRPLDTDFPSLEPGLPKETSSKPEQSDVSVDAEPVEPETLFRLDTVPAPPPVALPDLDNTAPIYDDTQLRLEPIDDADLSAPRADDDITGFDPDMVRTAPDDNDDSGKTESKSKWGWRGLFGAPNKSDDDAAKNIVTPPQVPKLPAIDNTNVVKTLTNMGLSPAAIVDDGCIIEAANTRKSKDANAMSKAVARRMATPVRHLREAAINDPAFQSDLTQFTAHFRKTLEPLGSDREAIREALESDTGRAFLLCDAALNGA